MNHIQNLKRITIASIITLSVSGCSIFNFNKDHARLPPPTNSPSNPCAFNKSSCMYNGNYEAGERQYAENEARRLNQAQLERLKRGF